MAPKITIGQLARSLGKEVRDISKGAREILGLPPTDARDTQFKLSRYQANQIQMALDASAPTTIPLEMEQPSGPAPIPDPPLPMKADPAADWDELTFGDLNHGLWVHPEVLDTVQEHDHLRKRLGIVLQHLGAHGRTSIVKGCRDSINRGWLRSPLGGNRGMQYYLWWAPQGSRPCMLLELPAGDILVRAVRHHNDHGSLDAGKLSHYFSFKQRQIEDEDLVGRPWTNEQLRFVEADNPVRLVLGRPGSGKTTVLWKAIEARSNQSVLYLTWSRELTRYAREHFKAFAPSDVRVDARDFLSFLGEICRTDIERCPLARSQTAFQETIDRLPPNVLGPWTGRERALFAELRAYLIGRAVPGEDGCDTADGFVRLSETAYLARRGETDGVGRVAAEALIRAFEAVKRQTPFAEIFPELFAAAQAINRLRHDDIPEGFADFDRVVVDEVQDLTLLEAAVVVEFCRAIARLRGHAPWLLVAGDDGQTVRPSGFDWGPLNDLIARRVGTPSKFLLEDNLRCPIRIAGVIERASTRYARLEKRRRPTKQRQRLGGQHVDGQLFHVDARTVADAVDLLERLDDLEEVVVLSPHENIPPWVPSHLQDTVLTPADAKGLEYQAVVLLDPGKLLARLERFAMDSGAAELEEHSRRTTIDQLRVSLSRATELLALVDVDASDSELALSWELLGTAAPYDPEDLAEHFTDVDVPADERVLSRTQDARALIDERPRRAWRRAYQAMRLLGNPDLPNGVATESVREEAYRTLLATAARLLVDGCPVGVLRQDVVDAGREAVKALGARYEDAFKQLDLWCAKRSMAPFRLLDTALRLGSEGEWLRAALASVAQMLRQAIAESAGVADSAIEFVGDVGGWLDVTAFVGDTPREARSLRCKALDTLIAVQDLQSAEKILKRVVPRDPLRTGQLREAQGRHEEAAESFERAAAPRDALRNWRNAGSWERAIQAAEGIAGIDKSDLQWLVDLQNLVDRRPPDQSKRLTKCERDRLLKLLHDVERGAVSEAKARR